jgi:LuxR family maltose regulon positive regulatory protein
MLEEIESSNSFLIRLDTRREWYRYHHLFGDLLRHELDASARELRPRLHELAASWLLDKGFWSEAILHTIASGELDEASELIDRHWLEFRDLHRLETIMSWLADLPAAYIADDPRLGLAKAATLIELGREAEGAADLAVAERGLSELAPSSDRDRVAAGVVANQMILDYLRGNVTGMRVKAGSALESNAQTDSYWHSVLLTLFGSALFLSGRSEAAARMLARGVAASAGADHALALTHALGWRAVVLAETGNLAGAREVLDDVDAVIANRPDLGEYYGTALSHIVRGRLLVRDDLLKEADTSMARGVELAARSGSALQAAYALTEYTKLKHDLGETRGRAVSRSRHPESADGEAG